MQSYSLQRRIGYAHFRNVKGKARTTAKVSPMTATPMFRVLRILKANRFEWCSSPITLRK